MGKRLNLMSELSISPAGVVRRFATHKAQMLAWVHNGDRNEQRTFSSSEFTALLWWCLGQCRATDRLDMRHDKGVLTSTAMDHMVW